MEDSVFFLFSPEMAEFDEVDFHLLVELVWHASRTGVGRAWFGPLPANRAGLGDVGYIVDRHLRYPNLLQEALHGEL